MTQLETEKTFLEGELKSRGHRKSLGPVNKIQTGTKHSINTSKSPQTNTLSSDNVSSKSNNDLSGERKTITPDTAHPQQQPQAVINLLEELDMEFSRRKEAGRGHTLGTGMVENTRPSLGGQPKVIRVSNPEKVNECSQQ